MANMVCPHCGSKYVEPQNRTDRFSEVFYCQSCRKTFSNDSGKVPDSAKWLMALYGDNLGDPQMAIYRDSSGTVYVVQKEYKNSRKTIGAPKITVDYYDRLSKPYTLGVDSCQSAFDSGGMVFTIKRIHLNSEFAKQALQNEAMRIIHESDDVFVVPTQKTPELLNDICNWLRSKIGVSTAAAAKSRQGCYIATCVYGAYDCPEVWTLRRFRDYTLAQKWYGRVFIHAYYVVSPALVKLFGNRNWFKGMLKPKLDCFVKRLQAKGYDKTPYNDVDW